MDFRPAHKFLIVIGLCTIIFIGDMSLKNGLASNLAQIVFSSNRDGNSEIYVMDANGESQIRLTHHPFLDSQAVWSPDGTRIAFVSNRRWSNLQIYIMDSDGGNLTRITDGVRDRDPAWSPDGSKIAYAAYPEELNFEIYVMDPDGKNRTRLTEKFGGDNHPSWSPDGQRIAFVSQQDGHGDIYVMDVDGKKPAKANTGSGITGQSVLVTRWSEDCVPCIYRRILTNLRNGF